MASNALRQFNDIVRGQSNQIYDVMPKIGPDGDFTTISGIDVLVNSIYNLLMTPLGRYPFDPTYGSELYKQVFELFDQETIEKIKYEVADRIAFWDPRVVVVDVNVFSFPDQKSIKLDVYIKRGELTGTVHVHFGSQAVNLLEAPE